MKFNRYSSLVAAIALAGCAVYPETRDTTQPNKIRKASLVCQDSSANWKDCSRQEPAQWYFRPTVIDAPYEAWWTFVGEQGDTHRIVWEITESSLIAYRTYEVYKGSESYKGADFKRGEPIAAWPITSHFDVWHQYNSTTGEQLPVLYESQERPWYEREFIRVDWDKSQISGYGFFMGSKLTIELGGGEIKAEPVSYAVNNPNDPDYRILSDDYIDIVSREIHTPMSVSGMDGRYFSGSPISEVSYRYSFMRAGKRDYAPMYYPDPVFEKFGYFRHEREVYDRERGPTDFKDYLINRWNIWAKTHGEQRCTVQTDCGGSAAEGVSCDLFETDAEGRGLCTLPYAQRGLKPITYYLSPNFPEERFGRQACAVIQGWNVALKETVAPLLNKSYTAPAFDDAFESTCDLNAFKPVQPGADFDPATQDLFVLKRNEKTCDAEGNRGKGDRWCYRAGDLRYSMLYWVDQPSSGSPLGYGPVATDPVTGEIIQGNSFIYGAAVDSYASYVGDVIDLILNQGDSQFLEEFRAGENVRQYYQNASGNSFPPTVPETGFKVNDVREMESLRERFEHVKHRAEELKRLSPAARSPFRTSFAGTWVEEMLVGHEEWKLAHGYELDHRFSEAELDRVSPFRTGYAQQMQGFRNIEDLFSKSEKCVYRSNEYTDATVTYLVEKLTQQGLGRDEIVARVLQSVFRGVSEHEVGHNMGLRHNFEASFDRDNYFEPYYRIVSDPELAPPNPLDFSAASQLPLTPQEYEQYEAVREARKQARNAQGVKLFQYSSIMDYGGQFYSDFAGLGKYDVAAVKFGYGNLVEVYDGAPNQTRSNRLNRAWYAGGEACTPATEQSDCPYFDQGQRCETVRTGSSRRACSSWDRQQHPPQNQPVKYLFCSDERAVDRPFCNRFDEGASSQEIVENLIESYERNYIFNNFRRYRRYFGPGYGPRIWSRYYSMMGKQFASLLYQMYYSQGALLQDGPGSVQDMLLASVKAMNFFERVLTTPDVGSYQPVAFGQGEGGQQRYLYRRVSSNCEAGGSENLHACLGVGKHFYSVWEKGYYGALERQARAGTFLDKIFALQALTNREWGNPQANDESYPLSFYDGFQPEMLSLFSGLISRDLEKFSPAVVRDSTDNSLKIKYRDLWSGSFFGANVNAFTTATPLVEYPQQGDDRYAGIDLLDPEGSSVYIQFYALILSLQSWPSIYDQTYADYMQLYTFGSPEVHNPPDGVETVQYKSPSRNKVYMAVQTPDQKSIIFPMVEQAARQKAEYDRLENMGDEDLKNEYQQMKLMYGCPGQPADSSSQALLAAAKECRTRALTVIQRDLDQRESFLNITYEVRKLIGLAL